MTRWLLVVAAVLAWIIGAALLFSPGPFFAPVGIDVTPKVATIAQAQGALLVGIGVINFLARRVTDRAGLRAILAGNLVVQLISLIVALRALALGLFQAGGAPSVVIHVVLGALFAVSLVRTRRLSGSGITAR